MDKNKPPQPGDVVMVVWPNDPGKKVRRGLVLATTRRSDGYLVTLCYGTSQHLVDEEMRPGEFRVSPDEDGVSTFQATGLDFPVKFSLTKICTLPFTDQWFKVPRDHPFGDTPKVGHFSDSMYDKVRLAMREIKPARR